MCDRNEDEHVMLLRRDVHASKIICFFASLLLLLLLWSVCVLSSLTVEKAREENDSKLWVEFRTFSSHPLIFQFQILSFESKMAKDSDTWEDEGICCKINAEMCDAWRKAAQPLRRSGSDGINIRYKCTKDYRKWVLIISLVVSKQTHTHTPKHTHIYRDMVLVLMKITMCNETIYTK